MNKKKNFKVMLSIFLIFCSSYVGVNATKETKEKTNIFQNCFNNIKNNFEKTNSHSNKSQKNIKTIIENRNEINIKKSKSNTNLKINIKNINNQKQEKNEIKSNLNKINTQENKIFKEPKKNEKEILLTKMQLKNSLKISGIKKPKPTIDFRATDKISYTLPNRYHFVGINEISVDLNKIERIINKELEKETSEIEKLNSFCYFFYQLFKIFDKNCKEIYRIDNLYKTRPNYRNKLESYSNYSGKDRLYKIYSKNKNLKNINQTQESMYSMCLETLVKYHMEQSVDAYYNIDRNNKNVDDDSKILGTIQKQANKLHQKVIFDIDTVLNYLWLRVEKMLNSLEIMNKLYNKYLNFINNIKNKELLNLRFVEKIIYNSKYKTIKEKQVLIKKTENIENLFNDKKIKELFDDRKAIHKLSFYIREILEYANRPEPIERFDGISNIEKELYINQNKNYEDYEDFFNAFINKDDNRDYRKFPVSENIKKGIELRKEIIDTVKKVVQRELYRKIFKSIALTTKRENEIIANVSPLLLSKIPDSQTNKNK